MIMETPDLYQLFVDHTRRKTKVTTSDASQMGQGNSWCREMIGTLQEVLDRQEVVKMTWKQ